MIYQEKINKGYKQIKILFLSLFLILLLFGNSFAKIKIYSFEEIIHESNIIVIGEVTEVNKNIFGNDVAKIKKIKTIKGELKEVVLKIKFGDVFFIFNEDTTKLEPGEQYVLFLKKDNSHFIIVGAIQGYYHIRDEKVFNGNTEIELKKFINQIYKTIENSDG